MAYQAEYIWLDGTEPTPLLRSKTKIMHDDTSEMPVWGFDGSSTNQATGDKSDCVLKPVFTCHDPIRGGRNVLVMCEVILASNLRPHPTNTRAACARIEKKFADREMWFGLEQEYTMLRCRRPPARLPGRRRSARRHRVRTTAASAPAASWAATSSRSTPRPASMPACRSRAPTPR